MSAGPSVDQLPPPGEVRSGPVTTTVRAPLVSTATRAPPDVISVRSGVPGSTFADRGPRETWAK